MTLCTASRDVAILDQATGRKGSSPLALGGFCCFSPSLSCLLRDLRWGGNEVAVEQVAANLGGP